MTPMTSAIINDEGLNYLRKATTYLGTVAFSSTGATVVIGVSRDFASFIPIGMPIGSTNASDDVPFIDTDVHTYDSTRGVVLATETAGRFSVTISRKTSGGSSTSGLIVPVLLIAVP